MPLVSPLLTRPAGAADKLALAMRVRLGKHGFQLMRAVSREISIRGRRYREGRRAR